MSKSVNLNIRLSPEIKSNAKELFAGFGITITDAINIFLNQAIMTGGFPFEIKQPKYNAQTEKAMQEAKDIMSGKIKSKSYSSLHEMIDEINSEADDL